MSVEEGVAADMVESLEEGTREAVEKLVKEAVEGAWKRP